MKKNPNPFDAVQLMRDLRQQISQEIEGMTPEEELAYFQQQAQDRGQETKATKDETPSRTRATR